MQKKVLIALFVILLSALGAILFNLINEDVATPNIAEEYLSPSQKQSDVAQIDTSWAQDLAGTHKAEFMFPVNELFMQIDLKKYVPPKVKSFRLVVDRTDRYSMFCILQTLSALNLPFVLEKETKIPIVHVTSKSKDSLKSVVKKLREYDIESKIIEVWL